MEEYMQFYILFTEVLGLTHTHTHTHKHTQTHTNTHYCALAPR